MNAGDAMVLASVLTAGSVALGLPRVAMLFAMVALFASLLAART